MNLKLLLLIIIICIFITVLILYKYFPKTQIKINNKITDINDNKKTIALIKILNFKIIFLYVINFLSLLSVFVCFLPSFAIYLDQKINVYDVVILLDKIDVLIKKYYESTTIIICLVIVSIVYFVYKYCDAHDKNDLHLKYLFIIDISREVLFVLFFVIFSLGIKYSFNLLFVILDFTLFICYFYSVKLFFKRVIFTHLIFDLFCFALIFLSIIYIFNIKIYEIIKSSWINFLVATVIPYIIQMNLSINLKCYIYYLFCVIYNIFFKHNSIFFIFVEKTKDYYNEKQHEAIGGNIQEKQSNTEVIIYCESFADDEQKEKFYKSVLLNHFHIKNNLVDITFFDNVNYIIKIIKRIEENIFVLIKKMILWGKGKKKNFWGRYINFLIKKVKFHDQGCSFAGKINEQTSIAHNYCFITNDYFFNIQKCYETLVAINNSKIMINPIDIYLKFDESWQKYHNIYNLETYKKELMSIKQKQSKVLNDFYNRIIHKIYSFNEAEIVAFNFVKNNYDRLKRAKRFCFIGFDAINRINYYILLKQFTSNKFFIIDENINLDIITKEKIIHYIRDGKWSCKEDDIIIVSVSNNSRNYKISMALQRIYEKIEINNYFIFFRSKEKIHVINNNIMTFGILKEIYDIELLKKDFDEYMLELKRISGSS